MDIQPTAFIAGASGYTGRALVRVLLDQSKPWKVVAHLRPDSKSTERVLPRFESMGAKVDRTPWVWEELSETLVQVSPDYVFCLVGTTKSRMRESKASGQDPRLASYEAVDYGLTKMLVRACQDLRNPPVFICLSAMGTRAGARSPYYEARWRAEESVRHSGLPFLIARPGFVSGSNRPDARPLERLGATVFGASVRLAKAFGAKATAQRFAPFDAQELARCLVRVAQHPKARNQTLEAEALRGL